MLYHFPSGRRYTGQTINTLWLRRQQHWWERDRKPDLLHQAITVDASPFSFVVLRLQIIPLDICWSHGQSRSETQDRLRAVATPLEREWTDSIPCGPKAGIRLFPVALSPRAPLMLSTSPRQLVQWSRSSCWTPWIGLPLGKRI